MSEERESKGRQEEARAKQGLGILYARGEAEVIVYLSQNPHSYALVAQQYTGPHVTGVELYNHTLASPGSGDSEGSEGLNGRFISATIDMIRLVHIAQKDCASVMASVTSGWIIGLR